MSKEKCYPFSVTKHQHDIEFRFNRVYCTLDDMRMGEIAATEEEMEALEDLKDQLDELRSYIFGSGPIAYIPGRLYGLAKESVAWAESTRDQTQALKHSTQAWG